MSPDPRCTTPGRSGFSLVEITIALGLFAFAILSILGLLGIALDTSRETQRDSTLASLIRTLDSEVRSATTTNAVTNLLNGPKYYDVVGKPTSTSSNAHFTVTFSIATPSTVATMLGLHSATNLHVWSASIAYPPPANPLTNVVLINHATY